MLQLGVSLGRLFSPFLSAGQCQRTGLRTVADVAVFCRPVACSGTEHDLDTVSSPLFSNTLLQAEPSVLREFSDPGSVTAAHARQSLQGG